MLELIETVAGLKEDLSETVKVRVIGEGVFRVRDPKKLRDLEEHLMLSLEDEERFREIYRKMIEEIKSGEKIEGKADFVLPPPDIRMEDARRFFKERIFRDDLFSQFR